MKRVAKFIGFTIVAAIVMMTVTSVFPQTILAAYRGGTITLRQPEPETIDPAKVRFTTDFGIAAQVFEGLVEYDPVKRQVVPCLADSWQVSSDGRNYTFKIKKGVQFHDGRELTSTDAKSSLERFVQYSQLDYIKELVASVTAPDPDTLTITLVKPVGFLVAALTPILITPTQPTNAKGDWKPIGTGPYKVKEWTKKKYILLTRNEQYHQTGLPYLDSIRFEFSKEHNVSDFIKGQITAVGIPYFAAATWMNDDYYRDFIKIERDLGVHYVSLNTTKAPLNDRRVRQALNHLLDLESAGMAQGVEFTRLGGILSPDLPGFSQVAMPYPFSIEAAKDLLSKVGYTNGKDKKGKAFPKITLICQSESQKELYDLAWGPNLAKVGIKYSSSVLSMSELDKRQRQGNYVAMASSWAPDYADPDAMFYTLLHPKSANCVGFESPEVTELIERGRSLTDEKEREKVYVKLQTLVRDLAPMLFGWSETSYTAVDPTLVNWVRIPSGEVPLLKMVWSDRPQVEYSTDDVSKAPTAYSEALKALDAKDWPAAKQLLSETRTNFPAMGNQATALRILISIAEARTNLAAGALATNSGSLQSALTDIGFEEQFLTLKKGELLVPFQGFEFEAIPWVGDKRLSQEDQAWILLAEGNQREFVYSVQRAGGITPKPQSSSSLPKVNLRIKPEYLYALMAETFARAKFMPDYVMWLYDLAIDFAQGNQKLIDELKAAQAKVAKEGSKW